MVAAGGDGTVNEVLNGLADVPGALDKTRLAVIPLGTVNVLAKELGIPSDFAAAWKVIRQGREWRIDLPQATFTGLDGRPETRCFALLAGTGLSARAIAGVDWSQKKRFGQLAYMVAGIRAMRPPLPMVTVTSPPTPPRVPSWRSDLATTLAADWNSFPEPDSTTAELESRSSPASAGLLWSRT